MIVAPRDPRYTPDIKVVVTTDATMSTGDGVFADTDLIRIPYDGYCMVNALCSVGGNDIELMQVHHQPGRTNHIPVLEAGLYPNTIKMVNYKIPIHKGETPRILYTENNAGTACFLGAFFRGMNRTKINNPVAFNTPDVTVVVKTTTNHANILDDTDLEDFPLPGRLLVWASSDDDISTIQVMQRGHQTGNQIRIPVYAGGLAVNCSGEPAYKTNVPATGNPTITITNGDDGTDIITVVASFYVDWGKVSPSMRAKYGY